MSNHHTKNKGDLGVLKAQCSLYEQGYQILVPLTEHAPYDLVAYKAGKFIRVQVKYRALVNGSIKFQLTTSWADRNGSHDKLYDMSEIDLFCIFCPETDTCYYVPTNVIIQNARSITLRVDTPKNNQIKNILFASDYLQVP